MVAGESIFANYQDIISEYSQVIKRMLETKQIKLNNTSKMSSSPLDLKMWIKENKTAGMQIALVPHFFWQLTSHLSCGGIAKAKTKRRNNTGFN